VLTALGKKITIALISKPQFEKDMWFFVFGYDFSFFLLQKPLVNSEVQRAEISSLAKIWAMASLPPGTGISQRVPKNILGAEIPSCKQ